MLDVFFVAHLDELLPIFFPERPSSPGPLLLAPDHVFENLFLLLEGILKMAFLIFYNLLAQLFRQILVSVFEIIKIIGQSIYLIVCVLEH